MISPSYCQQMAAYNQHLNQQIIDVCRQLSQAELDRDRGAFFGSIQATLNHLYFGDRIWLGRFQRQPYSAPHLGRELFSQFADYCQARQDFDVQILDWAHDLTETWLQQELEYHSPLYQQTLIRPHWFLVIHLFNHQTHHRGQVTTLLSQLGLDVGVTDLPWVVSPLR